MIARPPAVRMPQEYLTRSGSEMRYPNRYVACSKPQTRDVQFATCQRPMIAQVVNSAEMRLSWDGIAPNIWVATLCSSLVAAALRKDTFWLVTAALLLFAGYGFLYRKCKKMNGKRASTE